MQTILGAEYAAFMEAIAGEIPVSIQINPNKTIDLPYYHLQNQPTS